MRYKYRTNGVCAYEVQFDLKDNKVSGVQFTGGCNGNLKAVSKLVDGMSPEEIYEKLAGNECGGKGTSCADQFAKAVMAAKKKEEEHRV